MPELPSGILTVLHTEIEGSTLLTVHLGDRYPEVLATHCALLRAAFAAHEGHEVDTQGDSFFVVFSRATQAVAHRTVPPAGNIPLGQHPQTKQVCKPASIRLIVRVLETLILLDRGGIGQMDLIVGRH